MTKVCGPHLEYEVRTSTNEKDISVKVTPLEYTRGAVTNLTCEHCGAPAEYILG